MTEQTKILVVDDDPHLRRALERGLKQMGYLVELAVDGAEGYRLATASPPHVILTDIRMPSMDGHTLLRRLFSLKLDSAVVVMSAHGDMNDVVDALRNGAADFLKKPWTQGELVGAIGRALEVYEVRKRNARPKDEDEENQGPGAPAPLAEANAGFARVIEQLKRGVIAVPAVPTIVSELRTLVGSPRSDLDEVARLIERDQRLTAQVLRVSNCAAYARNGHSNDIRSAVGRIGFRQVQTIVETTFAHACWQIREPILREWQQEIWRYSLTRAIAMRSLAALKTSPQPIDPNTAYVGGLLCDVGASFLVWLEDERRQAASSGPLNADAVSQAVAQNHGEVGAAVLSKWEIDPMVASIAINHHAVAPPASPNPFWSLALLSAALIEEVGLARDRTQQVPLDGRLIEQVRTELRVGMSAFEALVNSVRAEAQSILEALG